MSTHIRKRKNLESSKTESIENQQSKTEQDLVSKLNSLIKLFGDNKIEVETKKLISIKSFESFDKLAKTFERRKTKKSFINSIIHNWDIIVLLVIIIIQAVYLFFFISSYISPESDFSVSFFEYNKNVLKKASTLWLHLNGIEDETSEECTVFIPSVAHSVLRPVDDCQMCIGLKEIKRVANISREEFVEKYAYSAVPVIVTDAMTNWTGLHKMNFNFLKELYKKSDEVEKEKLKPNRKKSNLKSIIKTFKTSNEINDGTNDSEDKDTCQFFPYKTSFDNLREVFEMEFDANNNYEKPWYVGWSNCNSYAAELLRKLYDRPYFLPEESEMSRLDWIFMGTPKYGAAIHIDDVQYSSWQAQISGIKLWLFKPPAECMSKCSPIYVDVYPGDVLVFDSNRWFHSTYIKGDEISLTIGSEYD